MSAPGQNKRIVIMLVVGFMVSIPIVAGLFKISGGSEARRERSFEEKLLADTGIECSAVVTELRDFRVKKRSGKRTITVTVQVVKYAFETEDGETRVNKHPFKGSLREGETIRIRYATAKPGISTIVSWARQKEDEERWRHDAFVSNVIFVVAMGVAAVVVIFRLRAKR